MKFLPLLLCLFCACTKTLDVGLDIVPACDQPNALDGLQTVTLRAEGDALDTPRERTFAYTLGSGKLPAVPPTRDGVITFLGHLGTADTAIDVAGAGGPYDFTGNTPVPRARLVVGRTSTFISTSSGARPSVCSTLVHSRAGHAATRLADGRVFITGGEDGTTLLSSTEFYDPLSGTFKEGPQLDQGRAFHSSTLMASGRVLICGGKGAVDTRLIEIATCVIFDPNHDAFAKDVIALNSGRMKHRALMLQDDRVAIIGGIGAGNDYLPSTEIYNPSKEPVARLQPAANLIRARAEHTATLLDDGSVLLTGGRDEDEVVGTLEIWTDGASRALADGVARYSHAAAKTSDGRVVIAGGFTNIVDQSLPLTTAAIEIFDATDGSVTCAGSFTLLSPRGGLMAEALPRTSDGEHRVLVAGGALANGTTSGFAEVITLARSKVCSDMNITPTSATMRTPRAHGSLTPLFGGDFLITGGSAAEIFIVPR